MLPARARGCDTDGVRPSLRLARAVVSLTGAAALLAYAFTGTSNAANATVQANAQNQFTPSAVTISTGDTVTWQWAGGFSHTVTSTSPNWSKNNPLGPPAPSLETAYLFDRAGTYTYVCSTHESVGMKGTVTVVGPPKPTKTPSPTRTSTRPSPTRTSSPPRTSAPPSGSASPTPSGGTATPIIPSGSPPTASVTPPPQPTVAPSESGTPFLGTGGLIPPPPTGRAKGLPVMLALLLIGGVGSAEVRALLANAPE